MYLDPTSMLQKWPKTSNEVPRERYCTYFWPEGRFDAAFRIPVKVQYRGKGSRIIGTMPLALQASVSIDGRRMKAS